MKPIIKIHRYWQDKNQTFGTCTVLRDSNQPMFVSLALERGWRGNISNVSCIPAGTYNVVYEYSDKFEKMLWEIKDVPNRSETKFHAANYWRSLNGCVALGLRAKKIDNDGYMDITNSRNTMTAFHAALKGKTEALLIITTEPNVK